MAALVAAFFCLSNLPQMSHDVTVNCTHGYASPSNRRAVTGLADGCRPGWRGVAGVRLGHTSGTARDVGLTGAEGA